MNPLLPQIVDQESHGIWIPRLLRGSVHMESKKRIKIPPGKERKKIEILDWPLKQRVEKNPELAASNNGRLDNATQKKVAKFVKFAWNHLKISYGKNATHEEH